MFLFSILAVISTLCVNIVRSCDDATWKEVEKQYDACVEEKSVELEKLGQQQEGDRLSLESCRKMDQLLECSALLTECMTSHFAESEAKLFSLPMDPSATNSVQECQQLLLKEQEDKHSVYRRAAGKSSSGGSSSGHASGGGRVGQVKSAVSSIIGNRKGTSGSGHGSMAGTSHKSGGGGKLLKKVGKVAVVGLAAYGTYKLAKSMTKGLRNLYDDDNCWQFNSNQGQYNCICNQQCNLYASGSRFNGLTSSLLISSTILSLYLNYFRQH